MGASIPRWLPIVVVMTIALFIFCTQSLRSELPDHGDSWTDFAHIIAARNLDRYGFFALNFAVTVDDRPLIGLPPTYLPHHPSFPAVVLGLCYRLGLASTSARVVPLLFSCSGLLALYLLIECVFKDQRLAFLTMLLAAAAAPFHLMADAFGYQSYDFAAKYWNLLFLSLAALHTGTRRWRWLGLCSLGAMLTISLSGFEMIPAMLCYALGFPLLFGTGMWRERAGIAIQLIGSVAVGLAIGFGARFIQNSYMLGSAQAVLNDFTQAFTKRAGDAGSGTGELNWGIPYNAELLRRLVSYYLLQVLTLLGGLLILLVHKRGILQLNSHARTWLGLIIVCELLWFIGFRQHAYIHVHTSTHILTSMSFAIAMVALAVWDHVCTSRLLRYTALLVSSVLIVLLMANVGVTPYGNIKLATTWDQEQAEATTIRAALPPNTVLFATYETYPIVSSLIDKPFILQPETLSSDTGSWEPRYLITMANDSNPLYQQAKANYRLLQRVSYAELYEIR